MKKLTALILLIASLSLVAAQMDKNGIVTKKSNNSVKATIDKIEAIAKKKGLVVFARINHKENAKKAGGAQLNDAEVIIFGNPKVGLNMLRVDPKAGLDLPLKVLAYKDANGDVYISYRDVKFYDKIYALEGCQVLPKMSGLLDKFTNAATAK